MHSDHHHNVLGLVSIFTVIKMLYISYHRFWFHLGHINDAGRSGTKIDKLYIGRSASYTRYSTKRTMCYAPRFHDYHKSYLAILAFNLEKIFPCIAGKNIVPICRLYTGEEDGFNRGRPIIEAGDRGNNFNMFGRKPVYGFAVQGCRYFTTSCMPVWWQTTLTCMLPRKYCS